ncbi:MAB_1171c family putative transporter [Lentzea sp. NPDC059081]|uniref:MAB_1171c family putative transporter n=1 Tax=Lentzea sp. NPDC059081 TaxID=3346719 RepID=UPI00369CD94D
MLDAARFYLPPLLVFWFFVVMLVNGEYRPRSPAQRAVCLGLLGLGTSLLVLTPAGYAFAARVSGVANIGRLIGHCTLLLVCWAGLAFVAWLTGTPAQARRRSRRAAWWLLAGAAVLTVLFVLAPVDVDDVRFATRYAGTPWVLEYWVAYVACLTPAIVTVMRETWRFARVTPDPVLRLGLRVVAAGGLCGLVYHVHKGLLFAAARFGFDYLHLGLVDMVVPLASNVFVFGGATIRWWAPRIGLTVLVAWVKRYRTYRWLRPLWLDLYRASPHIALQRPRGAHLDLLPDDLGLRLYRRVIEIRDGRVALQPYLDPAVAARARRNAARAGVRGQDGDAFVEATVLADALRAAARGRELTAEARVGVPGGGDLDSDTAFLVAVARAYRRLA